MIAMARSLSLGIGIAFSLAVAGWLELLPSPAWLTSLLPSWSNLVIVFWCAYRPRMLGVGYAWLYGLLLDLLLFSPLGLHALSKAMLALLAGEMHERFQIYGLSRQCLAVMVLCLIESLLIFIIFQMAGKQPNIADYWPGAVAAALLWPLCLVLLPRNRRGGNGL